MDDRSAANLNPRLTLGLGLLGALLLWASLPPWNLWLLGWVAPVPWLWLARLPVLPGRRPYWALYFSGAAFWIATNHWLRLPHPATSLGWFALSFYLACYVPLIVGLARVAARLGISIVVSGPVLWVAADQARAYVFSGFSMSSLCHSQYRQLTVIQIADVCGEFGVTFMMVLAAAAIARGLPSSQTPLRLRWFALAIASVAFIWDRGLITGVEVAPSDQNVKIALIQGAIESEVKHDPSKPPAIYDNYMDLSAQAIEKDREVQLIVWPETMYPYPYWLVADDARPADGDEWTVDMLRNRADGLRDLIARTAQLLGKPMLLGIATVEFGDRAVKGFNSALYVDAAGKPLGRYDKQHRVMFGEYIPLADWFPWLYTMTPLTGGIEAGERAESFTMAQSPAKAQAGDRPVRVSPNICYETVLARVIRRQVVELRERGEEPDVLVNLTNDSWFRGSSELDLHLACGVFRAVELRKPLLIAANTGFSALIDQWGWIIQQGPRRAEGVVIADVHKYDLPPSPYLLYGDWLAWSCLAAAVAIGLIGTGQWMAARTAARRP